MQSTVCKFVRLIVRAQWLSCDRTGEDSSSDGGDRTGVSGEDSSSDGGGDVSSHGAAHGYQPHDGRDERS